MVRSYKNTNLNRRNRREKLDIPGFKNLLYSFAMDASTILLKPFVK